MDAYQLVAVLANIATTVGVIVAIVVALRAGRADSRQSAATASRTEAAAALAEDNAQKIADAIRMLAQRPGEVAAARGVRWSLRNFENDRYILENIGDAAAEHVRVSAHESLYLDPPQVQDVGPGEPLSFMAALSLGTSDSTIAVSWQSGAEQETWRYPLPPRPRSS